MSFPLNSVHHVSIHHYCNVATAETYISNPDQIKPNLSAHLNTTRRKRDSLTLFLAALFAFVLAAEQPPSEFGIVSVFRLPDDLELRENFLRKDDLNFFHII